MNMNLMPGKGVRTRSVIVEEKAGVLNLLSTKPVGSPGVQNTNAARTMRNFTIPHIPLDDTILPEEYQGIRAFGSENDLAGVAEVVNDHLQTMRNKHAITLEWLRMGALKGIIYDSDASTVLYNLYTEFGITAKTVSFALGTATTKVLVQVPGSQTPHRGQSQRRQHDRRRLPVRSSGFYDSLVGHALVKEAFDNWQAAADRLGGDLREGFTFGGIKFVEYRGTSTDAAGTARPFIAANEAHAFPVGTFSTFETLFAPADFNETANTIGLELYAKQEPRQFNRGIDIHTQSNPLPICYRPGTLVKCTVS